MRKYTIRYFIEDSCVSVELTAETPTEAIRIAENDNAFSLLVGDMQKVKCMVFLAFEENNDLQKGNYTKWYFGHKEGGTEYITIYHDGDRQTTMKLEDGEKKREDMTPEEKIVADYKKLAEGIEKSNNVAFEIMNIVTM